MKSAITTLLIVSLLFSCKENSSEPITETEVNETKIQAQTPLVGTWELVGYYNYLDNKIIDSFQTSEGYRQVKMYTPSKVMWTKYIPSDSSEWFGYGSYSVQGNELTEILEYGSEMMTRIIEEKKEFKHELIINEDSFSQIEVDEDGNRLYAENYRRIE